MNAPFLICMIMFIAAAVAIPWAFRADRADAHLIHAADCAECEES